MAHFPVLLLLPVGAAIMSGPARSPAGKTALSSRVLGMKFMRRKDEAAHRDNLQRQQSTALEASHWSVALPLATDVC